MVSSHPRIMRRLVTACALGAVLAGALGGCTWVRLTDGGDAVTVLTDAPEGCMRVGRITSTSKDAVAGIDRNADRLGDEVEILARNEAATLGANTVVPVSAMENGRRVYEAWNCPR